MFYFCSYCKIFIKYLKEDAMASILTSVAFHFPLTLTLSPVPSLAPEQNELSTVALDRICY